MNAAIKICSLLSLVLLSDFLYLLVCLRTTSEYIVIGFRLLSEQICFVQLITIGQKMSFQRQYESVQEIVNINGALYPGRLLPSG